MHQRFGHVWAVLGSALAVYIPLQKGRLCIELVTAWLVPGTFSLPFAIDLSLMGTVACKVGWRVVAVSPSQMECSFTDATLFGAENVISCSTWLLSNFLRAASRWLLRFAL